MKSCECREDQMTSSIEELQYEESNIKVQTDVLVCKQCGEKYYEYPRIIDLQRAIAAHLCANFNNLNEQETVLLGRLLNLVADEPYKPEAEFPGWIYHPAKKCFILSEFKVGLHTICNNAGIDTDCSSMELLKRIEALLPRK